jgi:hypothetical protein
VRPVDAANWTFVRFGKALVGLDRRPESQELVALRRVADDRVRVADGDRNHLVLLPVDVQRLLLPHFDGAHLGLDLLPVAHRRDDLTRSDDDPDAIETVPAREPAGGDSRPVPGQLRGRPVRVPDHDLRQSPFVDTTSTMPSEPTPKW